MLPRYYINKVSKSDSRIYSTQERYIKNYISYYFLVSNEFDYPILTIIKSI